MCFFSLHAETISVTYLEKLYLEEVNHTLRTQGTVLKLNRQTMGSFIISEIKVSY